MDDKQHEQAMLAVARYLVISYQKVFDLLASVGAGYRPLPGTFHRQILDCYGAINEYLDMSKENHG